jgi:integrase
MELTDRFVKGVTVDRRTEYADESRRPDTKRARRGLILRVEPTGQKTWFVRKKVNGERFFSSIGHYPELGVAAARERLDDIEDHPGPLAEAVRAILHPEEDNNTITVTQLVRQYIREECEPNNRVWRKQQIVLDRELVKRHGDLPADQLTEDHVEAIVNDALARGAPRTAQEALKEIKGLYNWAMGKKRIRRQERSREALTKAVKRKRILDIAANPADSIIAPQYTPRQHYLDTKALKAFPGKLAATDIRQDVKDILTIQLQTFCRVGEVAGMRWEELNLRKREWLIPGERSKNGQPHMVMLSRQTTAILKRLKQDAEEGAVYVFPKPRRADLPLECTIVAKQINKHRAKLKQHPDFTSHSLRHSGSTWLTEQGCHPDVRERLLNHAIDRQGDMAARYNHHDYQAEKREWTQKWCDFLEGKKK